MSDAYIIRRLPESAGALNLGGEFFPDRIPRPWADLEEAQLDRYPWAEEYAPRCAARVGWNSSGIHVLMYAQEPLIRTLETQIGGDVCGDSCLEFFLSPAPPKKDYVNCESNPLCVMHIGVGDSRYGRRVFSEIPAGFRPTHSEHHGNWWAVSYTIPSAFLLEHFGARLTPGARMRGNFYSCGDRERRPHHGMYRAYDLPMPDFHRPELFADLHLADHG